LKRKWQSNAEFRERQTKLLKELPRNRRTRVGVPDGMTRKQAEPLWEQARQDAEAALKHLEKEGRIDFDNTSEGEMARLCLLEALVIGLSPMNNEIKNRAIRIVLDYTKPKPIATTELEVNNKNWLKEIVADHKATVANTDKT
jgi:hypothetical protein